jgi:hypothetical protein
LKTTRKNAGVGDLPYSGRLFRGHIFSGKPALLCIQQSRALSGKEIRSMGDAHRESERKGVSNFKAGPEEETEQLVVTINPAMGRIVRVEKIDKAGKHEELSEDECGRLVGEDEVEEIQDALDEAFEAAVVSVVGKDDQAEGEYEDDEEKAMRRFLISDLLIPPAVRRRILHRLLLSRLLRRRFQKAPQRR